MSDAIALAVALALAAPQLAVPVTASPAALAAPPAALAAPPAGRTQVIFDRYETLVPALKQPLVMVFEYTRTRSGPTRVVTEDHRVYRDAAGHERNETIGLNGSPVVPPSVTTYARADWPYGVDKFFVDQSAYAVEPKGAALVDGRKAYTYAAVLKEPGAFAVTELDLDAYSALPLREKFTASNDACTAMGSIDFGRRGAYWMPTIVGVSCVAAGADAPAVGSLVPAPIRDTIRFTLYSFPTAIPPQVFGLPPAPAPSPTEPLDR